jgi:hypothetical protein
MDPKDKIKAITEERSVMRQEIIAYAQALTRCVFNGLVAFGVLAGIYWKEELILQSQTRTFIIIVLSQLVFAIIAYSINLNAMIWTIGDYVAALEQKINILAEDKITAWESNVVGKAIWKNNTPFFWSAILLNFCLLSLFVGSFIISSMEIVNPNHIFIALLFSEVIIIIILYIWIFKHRKTSRRIAMTGLGLIGQ